MPTNYSQARDVMFSRINAALKSDVNAVLGYIPQVYWPLQAEPKKPDATKLWLRVSTQNVIEGQSTLSTCEGGPGQKQYETAGLLFIELYWPKSGSVNSTKAEQTAAVLRNVFRNAAMGSDGIRYYRARILDGIPPEELYYRLNVVTEYEYDENM